MGEIALDLFDQLQAPGTSEEGEDPEEKSRRIVNSMRSIFGLGQIESPVEMLTPAGERMLVRPEGYEETDGLADSEEEVEDPEKDDRYPKITDADWKARERARKLLRNILTRQVEACESRRKTILKESLKGPSHYERAAEIAPTHPNARLMRRMQDSNFREVRRLTNLLLKLKRYERKMGEVSRDVLEK